MCKMNSDIQDNELSVLNQQPYLRTYVYFSIRDQKRQKIKSTKKNDFMDSMQLAEFPRDSSKSVTGRV